jgi:hypothetical protein
MRNAELKLSKLTLYSTLSEQKFCDVDMVFVAVKWTEYGGSSAFIFVEVTTR